MNAQIDDFVAFSNRQLSRISDQSGKVLYSAADALKSGTIYLLGINPGGIPGAKGTTSIRENLQAFPSKTTNDYMDEI